MTDPATDPFAACYRHQGPPLVRGAGCLLFDAEGNEFLDLGAGVAVSALGHGHPALIAAIEAQAKKLLHTSNLYLVPAVQDAALAVVAAAHMDRVFFCNSGTEAIEAAIKLARRWFQIECGESRFRVVATEHSFHGRTMGSLSATGQPRYHEGFEPLVPGFDFVPYGAVEALRETVGQETAAILIEPIQGEGGVILPPKGYLARARAIADNAGCLLIFDEVQTGVGRTGPFLASMHDNVRPDVLTLAKGLAGGLPLGAMLHIEKLARALPPGSHMSTFGGNPVACAAACVVISTVLADGFAENVERKGARLMARLRAGLKDCPIVADVRGRGLLVGVVLDRPAAPVMAELLAQGVLATVAGGTVLRLCPPLVIDDTDLDRGADLVIAAVSSMASGSGMLSG